MKINPYQNNLNVNAYKRTANVSQTNNGSASKNDASVSSKKDHVTISSEAKQLNQTNRIETDRQQKVDALKTQIQNGQYKIQPQAVAEAFASYWQSVGGGNK